MKAAGINKHVLPAQNNIKLFIHTGGMMKKYRNFLAAPVILIVGVLISQVLSSQKQPMRRRPSAGGAKAVQTLVVRNQDITVPVRLTGPLSAYNKADIYAEVTGVLLETPKRLKTGHAYKKGELLVYVDDRVYKNNVLAQKSGLLNQMTQLIPDLSIDYPGSLDAWKTYLNGFDLDTSMGPLPEPASETERYYIASRNIYTQYYSAKSMEVMLDKYTIRAPFNGVVTDADINPGTLIRSGSKVATFTGSGHFEMEAFATPSQAARLSVGQKATLISEDIGGTFKAKITRINTVLDASQTVRVYLESSDNRLRDGEYLTAAIHVDPIRNAFRIPKTLLEKDHRVYVVENGALALAEVNVLTEVDDDIIVTGLKDGTVLLAEKMTGAKVGMILPRPGEDPSKKGAGQDRPQSKKQGAGQ